MQMIEDETALKARIESEALAVVLFSDAACNVCLSIYPELEEIEKKYSKAYFTMVEVSEMQSLVGEHLIFVYPTLVVFAMGKVTKRFERVFSMTDVEAHISRYYGMIFS